MATSEPIVVSWRKAGLTFEAVTEHGRLDLASGLDEPGSGVTPMEVLAVALGACTGMDVVSILQKMREPLEGFEVEVRGERADEHPRRFTSLEVVYRLRGKLNSAKVRRAIDLSESRYCSVGATLRPALPLTSRFVIEE